MERLDQPLISVVMPAYNVEQVIDQAVESILVQSFRQFELIIVDDGSTDATASIISGFARKDSRIKIHHLLFNKGVSNARQIGTDLARGRYIAVADADDIYMPDRLSTQIEVLESELSVGVCGSWIQTLGSENGHVWKFPTQDRDIRCHLLFRSSIANPTAMIRRELFSIPSVFYDPSYKMAEDYRLWTLLSKHCKLRNIPKTLVRYRMHPEQTSKYTEIMMSCAGRVRIEQLALLNITPSSDEFKVHQAIAHRYHESSLSFMQFAEEWLRKLANANTILQSYPEPHFGNLLSRLWTEVCIDCSSSLGISALNKYLGSDITRQGNISLVQIANRSTRCLIASIRRKRKRIEQS